MTISYDKLPMYFQTLLDVPMYERAGLLAHDIARPPLVAEDHTMTLTGPPTWTYWPLSNLTILSFNPATPDFLELSAANSVGMNFQAGAFSLAAWVFIDSLANDKYIIERGLINVDGWYFYVDITGAIRLITNQTPAAGQVSASANGAITIAGWWFIGATRLGNSVRIYRNGVDVTATVGNHVNPTACGRKLHVGIDDTELFASNTQMDGYISRPMIFGRQISPTEMWQLFEMSRGLYGV